MHGHFNKSPRPIPAVRAAGAGRSLLRLLPTSPFTFLASTFRMVSRRRAWDPVAEDPGEPGIARRDAIRDYYRSRRDGGASVVRGSAGMTIRRADHPWPLCLISRRLTPSCSHHHFRFCAGRASGRLIGAAALGDRTIAIADHNSLAGIVRAHSGGEEVGIRLVVGCRLDLGDGLSLLAFPQNSRRLWRLSTAAHPGQAPGRQGRMPARLCRCGGSRRGADRRPAGPGHAADELLSFAARETADFPGRGYLAADHLYRGGVRPPGPSRGIGRSGGAAPGRYANDVFYHVPERRPLQDVPTCSRRGCRSSTSCSGRRSGT